MANPNPEVPRSRAISRGGPLEKIHDDIDATQSVCHRNGAGTHPFGGGKVSGDKHFFRQSILPYRRPHNLKEGGLIDWGVGFTRQKQTPDPIPLLKLQISLAGLRPGNLNGVWL